MNALRLRAGSIGYALALAALPSAATADPVGGEDYGIESLHPDVKRNPHDRWATMLVDIDKKGRPTACKVLRSNLRRTDDRWLFCHGMMGWWRSAPVIKDGVAVPATVQVTLVEPSRETRNANVSLKEATSRNADPGGRPQPFGSSRLESP